MAYLTRRAPAKSRKRVTRRKRKNPQGIRFGKHRPVLIRTGSGWKRPKRSSLLRYGRYKKRPLRINPRKRRRYVRRNPNGIMKKLTSQQFLMTGVKIGTGFIAGNLTTALTYRLLPTEQRTQFNNYLGAVNIVIGAIMATMLKGRNVKEIGMYIAGTGVYDLIAANTQDMLGLPMLTRANQPLLDQIMGPEKSNGNGVSANGNGVNASYRAALRPVSPTASLMGASYSSPANPTLGLSTSQYRQPAGLPMGSDMPFADIEGWC